MTIRVALYHETQYRYDRLISVGPQEVRLKPAAHCRTPIDAYSLRVSPQKHFINWQQDPYGNFLARLVFPEKTRELKIVVDLVADMTVINPFDFFLEKFVERFPFEYPPNLLRELAPFLERDEPTPRFAQWLAAFRKERLQGEVVTVDMLVDINQRVPTADASFYDTSPLRQTLQRLGELLGRVGHDQAHIRPGRQRQKDAGGHKGGDDF